MKVSIEVKRDALTRQVSVTTYSIERALQLAGGDLPGAAAKVLFPIDPGEFFLGALDPDAPVPESLDHHGRLVENPNLRMEVAA